MNEFTIILFVIIILLYLYNDTNIKKIIHTKKQVQLGILLSVLYCVYNKVSYSIILIILIVVTIFFTDIIFI